MKVKNDSCDDAWSSQAAVPPLQASRVTAELLQSVCVQEVDLLHCAAHFLQVYGNM